MCCKQPIVVKYTALIFYLNSDGGGGDGDGDSSLPIQKKEMTAERGYRKAQEGRPATSKGMTTVNYMVN